MAKIRSLVYLDAFVLENGKCLFDYLPAEHSRQMRDDAAQSGEGYKITPIPAAAFAVNATPSGHGQFSQQLQAGSKQLGTGPVLFGSERHQVCSSDHDSHPTNADSSLDK